LTRASSVQDTPSKLLAISLSQIKIFNEGRKSTSISESRASSNSASEATVDNEVTVDDGIL